MLPAMTTWKLATAIAIISLAGCGADQREHTEAPPLPEPEDIEEPALDDSEPTEADASESDEAEADPEPGLPPPEPQQSCAGLPKGRCEATVGCAWSTTDDCIDQ